MHEHDAVRQAVAVECAHVAFQRDRLRREIARRTNAGESAVKVRIFRAKEKLRGLLVDLMDGRKGDKPVTLRRDGA